MGTVGTLEGEKIEAALRQAIEKQRPVEFFFTRLEGEVEHDLPLGIDSDRAMELGPLRSELLLEAEPLYPCLRIRAFGSDDGELCHRVRRPSVAERIQALGPCSLDLLRDFSAAGEIDRTNRVETCGLRRQPLFPCDIEVEREEVLLC